MVLGMEEGSSSHRRRRRAPKSAPHRSGRGDASEQASVSELTECKQKLIQAKMNRKRAESDAQMLTNRLLLLKAEMTKAQRKIEETRSRTNFIKKVQNESYQRQQKRREDHTRKLEANRVVQLRFEQKKVAENSPSDRRRDLYRKKRQEVQKIKEERKQNLMIIRKQKEMDRQRAIESKRLVQEQHVKAQQRKRDEKLARINQVKQQVQDRIAREERESRAKVTEIDEMEKEELRLIELLQKTQQLQKEAYDGLESALTSPPELALEAAQEVQPKHTTRSLVPGSKSSNGHNDLWYKSTSN